MTIENNEEEKIYFDLYNVENGKRTVAVERQKHLSLITPQDLLDLQIKKDKLVEIQQAWGGSVKISNGTKERTLSLSESNFNQIWQIVSWWTINIHRPELYPDLEGFLNNPTRPTSELCSQQIHWKRLIDPSKLKDLDSTSLDLLQKLRDKELE